MKAQHKACLEIAHDYLIEHLQDIVDFILNYLYQEGIIERDHLGKLRTTSSPEDKVVEVLKVLRRQGPSAFRVFRKAIKLKQKKHVIKHMKQIMKCQDSNTKPIVLGKLCFSSIKYSLESAYKTNKPLISGIGRLYVAA